MRRIQMFVAVLTAMLGLSSLALAQPDKTDTRLLQSPAVSKDHIAFVYADDLWVCDLDGGNVRRLTSHPRGETNPEFSPDGRTIAYGGQYDAAGSGPNFSAWNVYTVPVEGGEPTRLTWHPGWDLVRGWTPDGQVLFGSWRGVAFLSNQELFTIAPDGSSGLPSKLPIPNAWEASMSPDGAYIAYTPNRDPTMQWKRYRGGTHGRIWIVRLSDLSVEQIPQPEDTCNDNAPHWVGDTVYFRSDRNGEYNLFAYDTKSKQIRQLTQFEDFPVVSLDAGGGNVVFEQAGYIHRLDPGTGKSQRLKIGVAGELPETRTRYIKGEGLRHVRSIEVSPSGARAVIGFRGEVVTVPKEKGDPRNLTKTPGVHEHTPTWSPDGKSIAYFSDEGGEYALHIEPADGSGEAKVYDVTGGGFYRGLSWSPDSKKIVYLDNSSTMYWLDLESGAIKKIAAEPIFGDSWGDSSLAAAWSPDSEWIAYALGNMAAYRTLYLYSLADDKSHPITDGMSDATDPAFDAGGQHLYFLSSTDAGPVNHGFNLSSRDMRATRSLYIALLRKDTPSPLRPESDEEPPAVAPDVQPQTAIETVHQQETRPATRPSSATAPATQPAEDFRIDLEGLERRLLPLPVPPGDYSSLSAGGAGKVLYLSQPPTLPGQSGSGGALMRYDLNERKAEEIIASGVTGYEVTPDGKKAVLFAQPDIAAIVDVAPGAEAAKGKLNLAAVEVRVEPREEWQQIFDEAWRLNRDFFYDPGMHGNDWAAIKEKYAVFVPHAATSGDVYRIIRWMLSELTVSHSNSGRGPLDEEPRTVPVGLLGADFEIADGRYRFKKVYGGVTWWPEARAPLSAPGVEVKDGEYLLAVRGEELRPPENLYERFQHTGNEQVELLVGPNADGTGARKVTVQPLASFLDEQNLRHLDWVEGNRKKVHDATGGRVAYVYLPDTGTRGHTYFKRFFYAQIDKDAVILDERYNSGGAWADYYLDHLRKPFSSYWAMRSGADYRSPSATILGPKVMLINESAGSGGDGLPWMFRQSKLGPLVGKRTWGGEVGTSGYPPMLDGGRVSAPNFALWSPEEGWVVENIGVPPDVEVEQWPAEVQAGRDPQLEKAIEIILAELEKNPPPKPQRPPYPNRTKLPAPAAQEALRE